MVACETQNLASLLGLIAVGESILNAKYCASCEKNRLLFAHTYFLIKCPVLRKSLFRTLKRAL